MLPGVMAARPEGAGREIQSTEKARMFSLFGSAGTKPVRRVSRARRRKKAAAAVPAPKGAKAGTPAASRARPASLAKKPRASLGETVRRIGAGGMPVSPAVAPGKAVVRRGASFRMRVHAGEAGRRRYKLYLPACARSAERAGAPLPLVVMLHGCSQTPDDFAAGTRMNALAEEFGFLVAYPEQPRDSNRSRCWNWYKRSDQGRGSGEPALIAGIARAILSEHGADPARVYVAGLSAGGAAAATVGAAYPDLFAAIGVHSGLAAGAAHDAVSGMLAMTHGAPGARPSVAVPTIVFHGEADVVVNPSNGRYVTARALVAFPPLTRTEKRARAPGGRFYTRTVHRTASGKPVAEHWVVEEAGHAWSGGSPAGSFSDPAGPDASRAMVRFFLRHRRPRRRLSPLPPG